MTIVAGLLECLRTFVIAACPLVPAEPAALLSVDAYNVVWTSPSKDASGSMPIGNGVVGLNVWVEQDGDLLFYIARVDTWSECDRLLKLGRVRVSLAPNPFTQGKPFRQELRLREGRIAISASEGDGKVELSLYVSALSPVVVLECAAASPVTLTATLENWRTERRVLTDPAERQSSWTMRDAPADVVEREVWESADVFADDPQAVVWYHRNEHSVVPFTLKHQGLEEIADRFTDPLLNRTFGGWMESPQLRKGGAASLAADGVKAATIRITTHSAQAETVNSWIDELKRMAATPVGEDGTKSATARWWQNFWDRSWIFVDGDPAGAVIPANAHPLRIGADSNGQNLYQSAVLEAEIYARPLPADDIALASRTPLRRRPDTAPQPWAAWAPGGPVQGDAIPSAIGKTDLHAIGKAGVSSPAPDLHALVLDGGHFEIPADEVPPFPAGFTLMAKLAYQKDQTPARIFDKMTAGGSDGFIFDTHPGDALRLIVGDKTLHAPGVLKQGAWQHVAATYDAQTGRIALYLDGQLVKESPSGARDPVPPSRVTQAYILQRWMIAGASRGDFPPKFNGSIFTVEPKFTAGQPFNADWRQWGGCYWWQNTRLPYYPMLAAGDFDLMRPLFDFYEAAMPGCQARAKLYYHADGVYFPETMTTFATYSNADYGWNRAGVDRSVVQSPWWQYAWQQSLELTQLMLDYAAYSGDDRFLVERALPMARQTLRYYDSRFQCDQRGQLIISPTQAVETYWHGVINDAPSVAGLHAVCDALLALPDRIGTPEDRALWRRMKDAAPPLPTRPIDGQRAMAPAEKFTDKRSNCETPELYGLFPFRVLGLERPDFEAALAAYRVRHDKSHVGWTQDGLFAALLGLTDEARTDLLAKTRNGHPNFRFPAMWGPNFDWLPDQDHGSNLMNLLQLMLLQCDGDKIRLLPAWPSEWNVSFKLHAPKQTVIECVYRSGAIEQLVVTPESRRADVVAPK